jgi:hypothetical protein
VGTQQPETAVGRRDPTAGPDADRRGHHVGVVVFLGVVALSAYAGAWGLASGAIDLGAAVVSRLPWESRALAALALAACVALPMTAAALLTWRGSRIASETTGAAGLVLVLWIAVQLAVVRTYSFLQSAYLVVGVLVVVLAWALARRGRTTSQDPAGLERPARRLAQ